MNERARAGLVAYGPYGYERSSGCSLLLGFCGYWRHACEHSYPLGNGYRLLNTRLMRFNRPDELSPFGEGGINAYMYCSGDPVNKSDPSGRAGTGLTALLKKHGLSKKRLKPFFKMLKENQALTVIRVKGQNRDTFKITRTATRYFVDAASTETSGLVPGTYLAQKNLYIPWREGASSFAIEFSTGFQQLTVRPELPVVTLAGARQTLAQDNTYTEPPLNTVVQDVRGGGGGAGFSGMSQRSSASRR